MSKLQLRKEIAHFNAEQLREMLLDIYDARREAKEYLDFFLNPDVDKLTEKYTKEIDKEFDRIKRRVISPRWTRVRKSLKDYASFKPGYDNVLAMMLHALRMACDNLRDTNVAPTLLTGTKRLITDTLKYGDTHCLADTTMPAVLAAIELIPRTFRHGREARKELQDTVSGYSSKI